MKFKLGGRGLTLYLVALYYETSKMTKKLIHLLLKETKFLAISNKFMLSVQSLYM